MQTLEELIAEIKEYAEQYLRSAYNLGTYRSEDEEHPILPPLEPSIIPPPFPDDPLKIVEWDGDTECCSLQTWPQFIRFKNNFLYAGELYVLKEVICPIIFKRYGLKTIFYDLSAGYVIPVDVYSNGHPGESHARGGFDKQYYGWPNKLLVKPEYDFAAMCYTCFGERYECRVGSMEKAAMELVVHRHLNYIYVEPDHEFSKSIGSHSHHRADVGGLRIEKDEVDFLMREL